MLKFLLSKQRTESKLNLKVNAKKIVIKAEISKIKRHTGRILTKLKICSLGRLVKLIDLYQNWIDKIKWKGKLPVSGIKGCILDHH